jgi:ubiquinone/menaquinone biosynthesis C-methylase UbiE
LGNSDLDSLILYGITLFEVQRLNTFQYCNYDYDSQTHLEQVNRLCPRKSREKGYWDRVAEETEIVERSKSIGEQVPFKNWVADYADTKARDLLLRTFDRFMFLGEDAKILDVGCGPGKWTRLFAEKGFFTVGIDASAGMIKLAKARANKSGLEITEFYVMDASALGLVEATFDFVNCVTVLQHVLADEKWKRAIVEMVRVTKPKGYLLLYEMAPEFAFKKRTQNLRIRTLKDYETEFAKAGARLVFSRATDISFPLTFLSLRKFSTSFNRNKVYFYWARRKRIISLAQVLSVVSKMIAKVAKQIDYDLAETPFSMLSPLRMLLFRRN